MVSFHCSVPSSCRASQVKVSGHMSLNTSVRRNICCGLLCPPPTLFWRLFSLLPCPSHQGAVSLRVRVRGLLPAALQSPGLPANSCARHLSCLCYSCCPSCCHCPCFSLQQTYPLPPLSDVKITFRIFHFLSLLSSTLQVLPLGNPEVFSEV